MNLNRIDPRFCSVKDPCSTGKIVYNMSLKLINIFFEKKHAFEIKNMLLKLINNFFEKKYRVLYFYTSKKILRNNHANCSHFWGCSVINYCRKLLLKVIHFCA